MDPQQRVNRKKVRMIVIGIVLLMWGAMAASVILVIIGVTLIILSLAGGGGFARRSGFPTYRPQTPVTGPYQPPPPPQQDPGQENGLFPPRPWKFEAGDFDVVLLSPGPMEERVIGWIAAAFGVGREQAAALAARRLTAIKIGVSGADAAQVETALERLGANVDVVRRQARPAEQEVQEPAPAVDAIARQRVQRPVPHQGLFDAVLTNPGSNKIATRKALKSRLGLDLLQAYNAVEQTPTLLRTGITHADAERVKATLGAVGATIEVRPAHPSTSSG